MRGGVSPAGDAAGSPSGRASDGGVHEGPQPGLADLLAAVARQDRAALRSLYDRTCARLFGVAFAILRDRDAAADVLQDAYLKVWLRAGQYDPARGEAGVWLAAIVRHLALDAARARGREVPVQPLVAEMTSPEPDALQRMTARGEAQRLLACLGALDEHSRGVIVLAFVQGLSHAQLAARFGRPLGTVKSWVRGGLARLRACLVLAGGRG